MGDVTFDAQRPFWNGQRIQIERRVAKAGQRPMTIGTFRFSDVVIPSGATIRFRGFDVVLFQSSGDMSIDGPMDVVEATASREQSAAAEAPAGSSA